MDSTRTCDWCGESFDGHIYRSGDSIYCSNRCYQRHYHDKRRRAKWAATNDACLNCGVEFVTLPTRPGGYRNYCSKHCRFRHYTSLIDVRAGDKTEKQCDFCGEVKPIDAFSRCPTCADGHWSKCKDCRRERELELRALAKIEPRIKRDSKRCPHCELWLPTTPMFWHQQRGMADGLAALCRSCKAEDTRRYNAENPEAYRRHWKGTNLRLRMGALNHYGGDPPVCACCGEAQIEFLSIDHINGGGNAHRKEIGVPGGNPFYRWLRQHEYPAGYRVLCYNCNCARGHYGYCPHERERAAMLPPEDTSMCQEQLQKVLG